MLPYEVNLWKNPVIDTVPLNSGWTHNVCSYYLLGLSDLAIFVRYYLLGLSDLAIFVRYYLLGLVI